MTTKQLLALAALILTAACQQETPGHQGWIEADTLFVGAEDVGRIEAVFVAEGDDVAAGAPLFALDDPERRAAVEAARAAVEEARARLDMLEASRSRPEEISVLESKLREAQASLDHSIIELRRQRDLVARNVASQSQLDVARAAYDRDMASVAAAREEIVVAGLAARDEEIAGARASLDRSLATLAEAEARLARLRVAAPAAGRIERLYYRSGEVVPQGRVVVGLLPPENVKVRFFVAQDEVAGIRIGQRLAVTCDGCPGGLEATVSFIAPRAEFTPPVVYTPEERAKLVFKVEARPDRPEVFRIGQPVVVVPLPPGSAS